MPLEIKQDLQKLLDYMLFSEEADYKEWLERGDNLGDGHVYESVLNVQNWLNEQK